MTELSADTEIENKGKVIYCGGSAGVAQLVRAFPCHGKGCGFESRHSRKRAQKTPVWAFLRLGAMAERSASTLLDCANLLVTKLLEFFLQ